MSMQYVAYNMAGYECRLVGDDSSPLESSHCVHVGSASIQAYFTAPNTPMPFHLWQHTPPPLTIALSQQDPQFWSVDSEKKIIEIVATRCQILRLKCTKFDFGWGSTQDSAGLGELTALPNPQLDLRRPTSKDEALKIL